MSTKELFGDSSSDEDDKKQDKAEEKPVSSEKSPEKPSNKQLFGDSSSDDDDSENEKASAAPPVKPAPSEDKQEKQQQGGLLNDDSDDDEGDVEFDDAGAVVGLSSSTLAGQVHLQEKAATQAAVQKAAAPPPKLLHWTVQEATRPNASLHMTKLPNLVGIQTEAFDTNRYDPDEEEDVYGGAVHNLARWRYKKDATGNLVRVNDELVRESNTRLVEWEDGSWTLHVGGEAFEIDTLHTVKKGGTEAENAFAGLNGYLYLSQTATDRDNHDEAVGTILESMGAIKSRMTVKPSGLQSEAHKALTVAVRQKTIKKARIEQYMTQDDPEKLKEERIKVNTELQKAKDRKRPYSGGGGQGRRPRMSRSYLEEDDGDYDTINIRAMKKGARERDYDDDDMEDDYGDDDDDDEDDDEIFNRRQPSKQDKAGKKEDEDSSEDDAVMGGEDDDEEEETFATKKPAAAKKSNVAVLDDDDDSD